jgi:HAD superfamily hydrolase (TIGR01509 family)
MSDPREHPSNRSFTTVLFDIDGTLVDSNDAHAAAWVDVLAEHGRHVPLATVRPLIGMGGDKLLPAVTGIDPESSEGRAISDRRSEIFRQQYLPQIAATRGAADLVAALDDAGIALGIATSAQADEVKALLAIAGVEDRFDGVSSSDDAERSKPDPDIVHAALQRVRAAPENTVLVGDTPYDIEAAGRAGVAAVALRCGGWWQDADLRAALTIADDPADLLGRWRRGELLLECARAAREPFF